MVGRASSPPSLGLVSPCLIPELPLDHRPRINLPTGHPPAALIDRPARRTRNPLRAITHPGQVRPARITERLIQRRGHPRHRHHRRGHRDRNHRHPPDRRPRDHRKRRQSKPQRPPKRPQPKPTQVPPASIHQVRNRRQRAHSSHHTPTGGPRLALFKPPVLLRGINLIPDNRQLAHPIGTGRRCRA